jgi:4-amino-4-deoxy-L-arabinose transferase-like glycosyltransferase
VASARRTWLLLGALTVAGAALRLPFLGLQSLWYDETFTLAIVQQDSLGQLWDQVRLTESTPPLYYAVTWAWAQVVGDTGDAALRAPAAIAGVLCVPASYLAVRRFVGLGVALGVAALTAASPVLVSYSLNARAYPLLVLLACLSLWAMGEALERRGGRWLVAWAVLAAACLWTHYYAGFLVGAELAVLLWRLPGARLRVGAAGAAVGAAFVPLLPLLSDQRDERASHIESLDLAERVEQAVRQMAAGPNPPSRALEWLAVALVAAGAAAGAWVVARGGSRAGERESVARGPVPMLALAAAAVIVPLLLALSGIDDHFFMRNLLVAWAALAAIAALGLTRARAIPLALTLAVFVALTVATHADWRHQNADWEGALGELGSATDGVPVVVLPGFDAPVANAYLRRHITTVPIVTQSAWVIVEPGREGSAELTELRGYPRSVPPGFRPTATREYRGFRMTLMHAERPLTLDPGTLGRDQLEQRPAVLYSLP